VNPFTIPTLAEGAALLNTDLLLARSSAESLITQPDINLSLIPTLPTSQNLARSHATQWLSSYQQWVLQVLTNIQSYSDSFTAYYPVFSELCDSISNPHSQEEFEHGLSILKAKTEKFAARTLISESNLQSIVNSIQDDQIRFNTDEETLIKNYGGEDGELQELTTQINSLNQQLQQDNTAIAQGATQAIPGSIILGLGVGISYVSTSIGKVVINAGIKVLKGEVSGISETVQNQEETIALYAETLDRLIEDLAEAATFQTLDGQLQSFSTTMLNIQNNLKTVAVSWNDVGQGLNIAMAEILNSPDGATIQAQLDEANTYWKEVAQNIENYFLKLMQLTTSAEENS